MKQAFIAKKIGLTQNRNNYDIYHLNGACIQLHNMFLPKFNSISMN
jgi:hypothetical protein